MNIKPYIFGDLDFAYFVFNELLAFSVFIGISAFAVIAFNSLKKSHKPLNNGVH